MQIEKFRKFTKNRKILYVEDDDIIREEVSSILTNFFDTLFVACNGIEALNIYAQHKIDIIITDLKMPIMGGIELVKNIKKINTNQQVIVTSAHSEIEYLVELIELGVNSFLIKPVSLEHLLNTLYNILKSMDTEEKLQSMKMRLLKEKTTNELLNNIIHHWTQPITALGLQIFTLQTIFETNDKQRFSEITTDMENTIKNLADNLTLFQKIYDYKDDKKVNITEIVENLKKIVLPSLRNNNINLIVNINDLSIESVYKDFLDILLVFVDNSKDALLKTKPQDPTIKINITKEEDTTKINIVDNGGGIEDSIKDKIFDIYYSKKLQKNFTGVGLFFAKSVVEKKYNGKVELLKNTKNKNITNFLITIPNNQ